MPGIAARCWCGRTRGQRGFAREYKVLHRCIWEALRARGAPVKLGERLSVDEWLDEALAEALDRLERVRLRAACLRATRGRHHPAGGPEAQGDPTSAAAPRPGDAAVPKSRPGGDHPGAGGPSPTTRRLRCSWPCARARSLPEGGTSGRACAKMHAWCARSENTGWSSRSRPAAWPSVACRDGRPRGLREGGRAEGRARRARAASDFVRMFVAGGAPRRAAHHANVVAGLRLRPGRRAVLHRDGARARAHLARCSTAAGSAACGSACRGRSTSGAEVARALAYAHRLEAEAARWARPPRRLPAERPLSFEGEVKLTDFGIARALGAARGDRSPARSRGSWRTWRPSRRAASRWTRAPTCSLSASCCGSCARDGASSRARPTRRRSRRCSRPSRSRRPRRGTRRFPGARRHRQAALERDAARRTRDRPRRSAMRSPRRACGSRGDTEDLDLRALMRRLWPEGARSCAALAPRSRRWCATRQAPWCGRRRPRCRPTSGPRGRQSRRGPEAGAAPLAAARRGVAAI